MDIKMNDHIVQKDDQYLIIYYHKFHDLCVELYKSYRFYISTYLVVLTILTAVLTQVSDKALSIAISFVSLLIGTLFFYRICVNLSMEKRWLTALVKIQQAFKELACEKAKDCIQLYQINNETEIIFVVRIFYLPLFLGIPCIFIGYYFLQCFEKQDMKYLYLPIFLIAAVIIGEFIRSKVVSTKDNLKDSKGE
jgi:hypothetical protein